MPLDKILIIRKINLIRKDLQALKPLARLSFVAYQKKYENEILAERYLERIIGRMIDINYHLIIASGQSAPNNYFESFTELAHLKILPQNLAKDLAKAAGLRNRLAHEYDEIDEEKVYAAVKNSFKDIPKYLKQINEYLKQQKHG